MMKPKRILAALLTPFMMLLNCPVMAAQGSDSKTVKPTTEILHKPVASVEAGTRINLYTEVSDQNGVDVVRVYFKSQDAADYSFITLRQVENQENNLFEKFKNLGSDFKGQGYSGVLPAPANGSKSFEYLVLVKNKAKSVVKSQTYAVSVEDGIGDTVTVKEPVQVYTELSAAPQTTTGFSDNIALDMVEPGAKFGAVAGLYSGFSASGGGVISGGTVAASAGEFTTTAAVIGGVAAVAVIGGVAAVAGGGGSGSSDSGQELNSQTILGAWTTTDSGRTGTTIFYSNGTYQVSTGPSGRWTLAGNTLTLRHDGGGQWVATVSGNSNAFTASGPSTVYFTR